MNYDLFLPPAAVENVYVSRASSEGRAPNRTADGGIKDVANSGIPVEGLTGQTDTEKLERTVATLNEVFDQSLVGLQYRVDTETGDLVVSIVDRESGEVLRQMPAEAILVMRQKLQELMGVLFDVTA